MPNYNPESFTPNYHTALGRSLWAFLNEEGTITRMKTATSLGRPAAEGIEEELLERFETDIDDLLADRTKQMIGHMIRQVMESLGYVIDMQNVKIMNGAPFARATRYKLVDDMTFHVFANPADRHQVALTADKAGSRLPSDVKWVYEKSFKGGLRGRIVFGLPDEKVARAEILQQGYHRYRRGRMLRKP
jgi:hypothetical protein